MQPLSNEDVRQLIAGGETLEVEFKRAGKLSKKALAEAVTCLANGNGGTVLVGVEDDGRVTGYVPYGDDERTEPAFVEATIQGFTRPPLAVRASIHDIDEQAVLAVQVSPARTPVCTSDGLYQHRIMQVKGGPACVAMEPSYLFSRYREGVDVDWAGLPAYGASLEDLDAEAFRFFRDAAADDQIRLLDNTGVLRALGLYREDGEAHIALGAILLFGRESALRRWVPHHEVLFQVLSGGKVVVNESLREPLFLAARSMTARVKQFATEEELMVGLLRFGLSSIPAQVSREAIANALVHRDYTHAGAIRVTITDEAFTVESPGGFPRGITFENILEATRPRSLLLADAFKRARLVERTGRGVALMFREAILSGVVEPTYRGTSDELVEFIYPISPADTEFAYFVRSWQADHEPLAFTQLRLLRHLRARGHSSSGEMAEALGLSRTEVASSANELATLGLIARVGVGRGSQLGLGPAFFASVKRDGEASYAAPATEAETVRQLAMADGQVTRSGVMKRLALTGPQAYRLLTTMVAEGELIARGAGRGAHYVLPEKHQ